MHNGVDPDEYGPPDPAAVAEFRAEHGLGDRPVVLLAARLSGSKGAGQLVEAMAQVPGDAVAVLLGNNPAYQEKLTKQAAQHGIAERVRFLGWLNPPAVKLAYHASDLVVAPSTYPDPFNLTLIEGMACGKPVIGSAFGAAYRNQSRTARPATSSTPSTPKPSPKPSAAYWRTPPAAKPSAPPAKHG